MSHPGSRLPPGWERVLDPGSGQYYFYNSQLGVTQWDPPEVGATRSQATFVTRTVTRKPVATRQVRRQQKQPRPHRVPVASSRQAQRERPYAVQTTTTTRRRGGNNYAVRGRSDCSCVCNGAGYCSCGDWVFVGVLAGVVVAAMVLAGVTGNGYGNGGHFGNTWANVGFGSGGGCGASMHGCNVLAQVLDMVNDHRASRGLGKLSANSLLNDAAQRHACYMAQNNVLSHEGGPDQDDKELGDRVDKTGYPFTHIGENVAAGQNTARTVVDAWLASDGHRVNIENPQYTELGLGYRDGGSNGPYWCQVFGRQASGQNKGNDGRACSTTLPPL